MTAKKTKIISNSCTHVGKVRTENEDALRLCDPDDEFTHLNGYLFGIADGMGGYAHGKQASSLALDTFFDTFYDSDGITPIQKFKAGMQNANLSVYQTAQKLGVGRMGTTLTAINIIGNTMYIGHVGDTRAYLIRNKEVRCLTNDHTRVGELVRMKVLPKHVIRTHNQRSVLEKCLGFNLFVQPDVFKTSVHNDDVIIMCTDGVWSVIEDEEFLELANTAKDANELSKKIVDVALTRDHDDNLTALVVHIQNVPETFVERNNESNMLYRLLNRFVK